MGKFDLKGLGVNYTVFDNQTKETCHMKIIDYSELKTVTGEFVGEKYTNLTDHLEQVLTVLTGFVNNPYNVTWYSAKKEEFSLPNAVQKAKKEGNEIVVVEIIPEEDIDIGFEIN